MSEFHQELDRVLRYGRAPIEGIHSISRQGRVEGMYNPQNTSDRALADFLDDHDDPRSLLVHRDLSYRGEANGDFGTNYDKHADELFGHGERGGFIFEHSHSFDLGDGTTLVARQNRSKANSKRLYETSWLLGDPEYRSGQYDAPLTPDELKHLLNTLGVKHSIE